MFRNFRTFSSDIKVIWWYPLHQFYFSPKFSEILTLLMPGVQHHINNPDQRVQSIGMLSAEIVTATIDPDGPRLKFGVSVCFEV